VDERWERALAWHQGLPMGRRKVEYNATILRILSALQDTPTIEGLDLRYAAGLDWATEIAKDGFPDTPALWATERTADVAFGLRARQILGLPGAPPAEPPKSGA
jgi:hypothetical protein